VKVTLAYGRAGLVVELPDDRVDVIAPPPAVPGAPTAQLAFGALVQRCRSGRSLVVAVCDHTRPQPRREVLGALLGALPQLRGEDLTILVATGSHRASTPAELEEMLGRDVLDRFTVEVHDADASPTVALGMVDGDVPVSINRTWVEADLRISTGFVEPHFFAGFSGGPKLVTPGLAGLATIEALHDARRISDPTATWGVVEGNAVHDAVRAAAALAEADVMLDVLLDRRRGVTAAFCGPVGPTHAAACAVARRTAMVAVERRYEVVVTTNAGHPLDQNLYQAVKGMRAAAQVVAPGGLVICAAACEDGVPEGSPFANQLVGASSPTVLLDRIHGAGAPVAEQWQVQILAEILRHHRVGLRSDGIPHGTVAACGLEPIGDVGAAVVRALDEAGPAARACVLVEGPEYVPYLVER
jgi:nickel-dependent lactate racemase